MPAPVRERAHGELKCGPGSAAGTFTVRRLRRKDSRRYPSDVRYPSRSEEEIMYNVEAKNRTRFLAEPLGKKFTKGEMVWQGKSCRAKESLNTVSSFDGRRIRPILEECKEQGFESNKRNLGQTFLCNN